MERDILCDSCREPALVYDTNYISVSSLEGKVCHCESCSALGRVVYDDELGRVYFRLLDSDEISHVDFGVLVDAYEASQKRIAALYDEVARLRVELMSIKSK